MKLSKYKQVIITFMVLSLILTLRLKRVEVKVQAFNDNTQITENVSKLSDAIVPETTDPQLTISEGTLENRSVYSAGLDRTFTIEAFNQLDVETLVSFKGIGLITAEAIINDRKLNGPLENFDDLKRIKGIGDKKLENILYELP